MIIRKVLSNWSRISEISYQRSHLKIYLQIAMNEYPVFKDPDLDLVQYGSDSGSHEVLNMNDFVT